MGIERSTFLIDSRKASSRMEKSKSHWSCKEVLEAAKQIKV